MCLGTALGCCASCVCGACTRCEPAKRGPMSRIPYLFLMILAGLFATIMSLYGEKQWDLKLSEVDCKGCTGNGTVFRVSIVLFVFEIIHVIFIAGGAVSFHWRWFPIKLLVFVSGVVLTFFVGTNGDYQRYAEFARYGPSPIYLIIQVILLIGCTYDLNDSIQMKGNSSGSNRWFWLLIVLTASFYVASFTLMGLFYDWFVASGTCPTHETLISTSLGLILINLLASLWVGRGILFVGSVISFYVTWLVYAAMMADNVNTCNKMAMDRSNGSLWIGVVFTLISLCYAALKANLLDSLFSDGSSDDESETPLLDENPSDGETKKETNLEVESAAVDENGEGEGDGKNQIESNYDDADLESNVGPDGGGPSGSENNEITLTEKKESVYFHIIMTLAAAYMAMLLSNWATGHGDNDNIATTGKATVYANMAVAWLTEFLFLWTLIAPKICPSRFNYESIDD